MLLEPAAVAASSAYGLRLLYVALTRAVSSLIVLHTVGLPPELRWSGQNEPFAPLIRMVAGDGHPRVTPTLLLEGR